MTEAGRVTTPGLYVMPGIVAAFRAKHPGVDLKLQVADSQVIEDRVREREVDLGIVGGHAVAPGEECLAAGMLDELVLIVAPTHAWARRRDIAPHLLAEESLLVREDGSATRSVTERALQRAGVRFRVAMELDHTEAIKQGVMAGLGLGFVSIYAVRGEIAAGRLCPSDFVAFESSDTSMSSTTKPGESRRAHGPSWSCSSRRHEEEGMATREEERIKEIRDYHCVLD